MLCCGSSQCKVFCALSVSLCVRGCVGRRLCRNTSVACARLSQHERVRVCRNTNVACAWLSQTPLSPSTLGRHAPLIHNPNNPHQTTPKLSPYIVTRSLTAEDN
jgi:hypothetical protein